jgi:hypothetical protein
MKKEGSRLEYVLELFNKKKLNQKDYTLQDLEIIAVNNLIDKKDIQKFYSRYLERMEEVLNQEIKEGKENLGTKLINAGYAPRLVARYFAYDNIYFTLGHIFNQKALKAWYPMPFLNYNWSKEFIKDKNKFS